MTRRQFNSLLQLMGDRYAGLSRRVWGEDFVRRVEQAVGDFPLTGNDAVDAVRLRERLTRALQRESLLQTTEVVARARVQSHLLTAALITSAPEVKAVDFAVTEWAMLWNNFRDKVPMSSTDYEELTVRQRASAYRIVGVESAKVVAKTRNAVDEAIREGTFREAVKTMRAEVAPGDFRRATTARLQLVLRQNVQHAYAASRRRTWDLPAVADLFTYGMYTTARDAAVRPSHSPLDGMIFHRDDEFWQHYEPPWGWNCRCDVILMRGLDVERRGLIVSTISDVQAKGIEPDADFDFPRDLRDPVPEIDPEVAAALESLGPLPE